MKIAVLEKCLRILDARMSMAAEGIEEIITNAHNLISNYIIPFREELDLNIIDSSVDKDHLIRYYISKFIRLQAFFPAFKSIIDNPSGAFYKLRYNTDNGQMTEASQYRVNRHYLYALLFNEIQKCCYNYQIPFLKICRDLCFELETIDFENSSEGPELEIITPAEKSKGTLLLPEIKPIFTPEFLPQIFDILKDYFSQEQQSELLAILKTGNNAKSPLCFLDSGNRLADAFKQLYDSKIIKGCLKKELIQWIGINFHYRSPKGLTVFTLYYLHEIISTKKDKCHKPILNVTMEKGTGNYLISKM